MIYLFFVFHLFNSNAQSLGECGTISPVNLSSAIEYYNNLESLGSVASSSGTQFEIPINLVLVTDSDGGFYFNNLTESEIITEFSQALEFTNELFTDNYSFSLCTHVVSAPTSNFETVDLGNDQDVQQLAAISYSNFAINCYVVSNVVENGPIGQAIFPFTPGLNNMITIQYSSFSIAGDETIILQGLGRLLAHEIGHHLGLFHTDSFAFPDDDCLISGDLMCSTPPDVFTTPGGSCSGDCNSGFDCVYVDPSNNISYVYDNFIRDNVMYSFSSTCQPILFEDDQLERMRNVLFGDPVRWNLVQNPLPDCINYFIDDGYILRPRIEDGDEELDPFVNAVVDFDQSAPLCSPNTNILGRYFVDGFATPCNINAQTGDIDYFPRGNNPANENYDYANGVTVFDLFLITRHILGTQELESPFQKIAADVNNSGTITTLDNIRIRKLILGLSTEFDEVDSWRFVPALGELDDFFWSDFYDDPFTAHWTAPDGEERYYNAGNAPSYLSEININTDSPLTYFDKVWTFYAVKSGDVNGTAKVGIDGLVEEGDTFLFTETKTSAEILANGADVQEVLLASVSVSEGETVELAGYQFSVNFDDSNLELIAVEPGDIAFSSEDFVVDYSGSNASIRTLWTNFNTEAKMLTDADVLFTLVFRPKQNLTNLNGMVSFGGAPEFKDLVISSNEKLNSTSLEVSYKKANVKDFIVKEAYGNPFTANGNLHLSIEMKELKNVSVLLQDNYGHTVLLDYNDLVLGDNDIEIPANTVSFLQNGSIFYSIATDEYVQTGTIIKMQ